MILKTCNILSRLRKRFRRNDSGATAIEFAFLGGPFLFFMLATIESGLALFAEYTIQNATTQASRLIRTGQAQNGGFDQAQFKQRVCDELPDFMDCGSKLYIDVQVYNDFSAANFSSGVDEDGNVDEDLENASFEMGTPGDVVVVQTYYVWDLFVPFMGKLIEMSTGPVVPPNFMKNAGENSRVLMSTAVFQNEPYNPAAGGGN